MSKVKTRLYVQDDLRPQTPVLLTKQQCHFLKNVLRLDVGDAVGVFNGKDGEWHARINQLTKTQAELEPQALRQEQSNPPFLRLLFAPVKKDALNFLIEKGTELGVTIFQPVITRYTHVERVRVERLQTNAMEAAEQCGRLEIPTVLPPLALNEVLNNLSEEDQFLACLESGEAQPFTALNLHADKSTSILIGPEGGFSEEELASLRNHSSVRSLSLGPRILRAETAAVSAVAIYQSLFGDWNARPKKTLWPDSFSLEGIRPST